MKLAVSACVAAIVIATGWFVIADGWSWSDSANAQYQELRDLAGFTDIVLNGDIGVEIMQGDEFLVEVEASDDALGGLHTVLEGTTLDIHPGAGSRRFFGLFATDYEVRVTLPELKSLTASRGAEVDGAYTLTGGTLALIARSGSEFDLAIDVASIEIEVSGGSDMDLSGTAGTSTIHVRGGSEFSGGDFIAEDVTVDISGGSEAFLTVTNRITGSASGGSVLVYQGNPVTVEVSSSRNASVVRR